MRVTRLQLANYRCFRGLDVDIDPITVFVGANDSGKSTILSALRSVLHWDDDSQHIDWRDVVRVPDGVQSWDADLGRPVTVVVTFSLSPEEQHHWGPLAREGQLRLGRLWRAGGGTSRWPYVLLSAEARDWAASVFRRAEIAAIGARPDEIADRFLAELIDIDGEYWIDLDSLIRWPWPRDRGFSYYLLPRAGVALFIPGPEHPIPSPDVLLRPLLTGLLYDLISVAANQGASNVNPPQSNAGGAI